MSNLGECGDPLPYLVLNGGHNINYRPGWQEFLSSAAQKYELHVYTMGTRAYAEEVCAAIDPDGRIFGGRILSRDESGSEPLQIINSLPVLK